MEALSSQDSKLFKQGRRFFFHVLVYCALYNDGQTIIATRGAPLLLSQKVLLDMRRASAKKSF
jgi:hypothetical protein